MQLISTENVFPRLRTAIIAISLLIIYAIIGTIALVIPTRAMKNTLICSSVALDGALFLALLLDLPPVLLLISKNAGRFLPSRSKVLKPAGYRPVLMGTTLTALMCMLVMTVLYSSQWYAARNTWKWDLSSEANDWIPYPSITFVQDIPAPYQANLLAPSSCYIGQSADSPPCDQFTAAQMAEIGDRGLSATSSCNCTNHLSQVQTGFVGPDNKRYIQFKPSANLVASSPQVFLALSFIWNVEYAQWPNKSEINVPSVWMLLHDRSMDTSEAYQSNISEYTVVNAAAFSLISMSPVFKVDRAETKRWEYHAMISSIPQGIHCDISGLRNTEEPFHDCTTIVVFRIQNFENNVLHEVKAMDGEGVANALGAWFALIQAVVWLLSLMALSIAP